MRQVSGWIFGVLAGASLMLLIVPVLGAMSRVQNWHHGIGWNVVPVVAGNFLVGYGWAAALAERRSRQATHVLLGLATLAFSVLLLHRFQMPTLSQGGFCGTCQRSAWEALAAILVAWGILTKSLLFFVATGHKCPKTSHG